MRDSMKAVADINASKDIRASGLSNSLVAKSMLETGETDEPGGEDKTDEPTLDEIALCKEICHRERGHCTQWRK